MLAGPVEVTSELARLLPQALAERVVGTVPLAVEASPDEVLAKTLEVAQRVEREAEQAQVRDLLDRGRSRWRPRSWRIRRSGFSC